jgi:hypothetical protein
MTSDHRAQPDDRVSGSVARGRAPRLIAMTALVVLAGVGGTWGELRLAGAHRSGQSAGVASQDAAGAAAAASLPTADGPGPSVAELLPETSINDSGYHAVRAATRQGADCADLYAQPLPTVSALPSTTPPASATASGAPSSPPSASASASPSASAAASAEAAAKSPDCQGYAGASYVTTDHSVYTSVTILGFPDRASAALAASRIASGDVSFEQPGAGYAAMVPQAGSGSLSGQVKSVGRFVTVTVSAYADGRAADQGLAAPTSDVAYTAGAALLWL